MDEEIDLKTKVCREVLIQRFKCAHTPNSTSACRIFGIIVIQLKQKKAEKTTFRTYWKKRSTLEDKISPDLPEGWQNMKKILLASFVCDTSDVNHGRWFGKMRVWRVSRRIATRLRHLVSSHLHPWPLKLAIFVPTFGISGWKVTQSVLLRHLWLFFPHLGAQASSDHDKHPRYRAQRCHPWREYLNLSTFDCGHVFLLTLQLL